MAKIWTKLTAIMFVVIFILAFRSLIITDSTVSDAFKGLMGTLPFAEPFSELVCNVLKYNNGEPLASTSGFVEDVAKLMVMACIQPVATYLCSLLFLKIPSGLSGIDEREAYMNGLGYRMKELLIQVVTAPLSSIAAGIIMEEIIKWAVDKFGVVGSVLTGLLSTLIAAGLAAVPMIFIGTGVSFTVALLWRFLVTMLGGMLTALATTVFSIAIYYAFVYGLPSHIAGSVVGFFISLIILDIVIQCFQRALGAYSVRR